MSLMNGMRIPRSEFIAAGYYPVSGLSGWYMNENRALHHSTGITPEYVERDGKIFAIVGPPGKEFEVDIETLTMSKTYRTRNFRKDLS